ncbi:MAG: glycosyltransferase [Verrucomicrobiales bacterium]
MEGAPSVSFVIPCRNDADLLGSCLDSLVRLDPAPQLVVADASDDKSPVRELCAHYNTQLVEVNAPCRGAQLDAGAALAGGELLVFHHADSEFSQAHYNSMRDLFVRDPMLGGGAFLKDLAAAYPQLVLFRPLHRLFTRHIGIMYGDQSVFVMREVFEMMGGFGDLPLMEDVSFSARLRDTVRVQVIGPPLRSSRRKFAHDGVWRRKLENMWLVALFRLGVSPEKLAQIYYRTGARSPGI